MATTQSITTAFFDLGATLVDPQFEPNGKFAGFAELPGARDALDKLSDAKLKLGVISNTGELDPDDVRAALKKAKLLSYFTPNLVLLSGEVKMTKATPAIFQLAVGRAGSAKNPAACLFVGDEPAERRTARRAGMRTSYAPRAAVRLVKAPKKQAEVASFANLAGCVDDARDAGLDSSSGPAEPNDYNQLIGRLEAVKTTLPPLYQEHVSVPFLATLRKIGQHGFSQVLAKDPKRVSNAGLMFDIAQAILQNGEKFEQIATDAFEEVVSDLYDGFLSAEDRSGIKLPDNTVLAPLVKWGNPDDGPYTWPIDATSSFGVDCAVVNLPPANAHRGLFAWAALGHETAGHDILHADDGLQDEFSRSVLSALKTANVGAGLAEYWSERIDETASDVMGILNMGPAAAIGLVIYFRGLNAAFDGTATLRNSGPASDPHPADILRGFLAAATVRLLSFDGAAVWADAIERETLKDVTQIRVASVPISVERAKQSCDIVANVLAATRMSALNHHALIEIQNWRNGDEQIVAELQRSLVTNTPIEADRENGVYAAHVVAGATLTALAGAGTVPNVFQRMIAILKQMHDANAAWGPLFVAHPGSISRDYTYVRTREVVVTEERA